MHADGSRAANPAAMRQFITLSADRTHLVNTFTNQPVFISGDTAQNLSVQLCNDSDVDAYLSNRAAKHMNAIWVWLIDIIQHNGKGGIENDCSGNNPWNGGPDFTGMSAATTGTTAAPVMRRRSGGCGGR